MCEGVLHVRVRMMTQYDIHLMSAHSEQRNNSSISFGGQKVFSIYTHGIKLRNTAGPNF